jgi:hypothetical protein
MSQAWDLSMLVLIIYSCVVIPFRIGMSVPNPTGVSQVRSGPRLHL